MEPRLGFHESDGIRLRGMATRRHSLEGGITLDYDADVFAVSAALFTDLTKSSHGSSARLSLYRPLVKNNRGEIGLLASADRLSTRTANYFLGVNAAEATSFRPQFSARAGTNISAGIGGTYRSAVNSKDAFIFGANIASKESVKRFLNITKT